MKAIRMHEYGGPEMLRLEEIPTPVAGDGEIRVRVHAASVNPIDWKIRQGFLKGHLPIPFPWTPGIDFSGVTDDGAEVFGKIDLPSQGSYAEYVIAKPNGIAPRPRGVDHVQAAALPLAGLTAWQALFGQKDAPGLDLRAGQTLLILGAGGAIGGLALQLARWKGAHPIGLVRPGHESQISDLGARAVNDPESAGNVDAVLDLVGGELAARAWAQVGRGGAFASALGPPSAEEATARGVRPIAVFTQTSRDQLVSLSRLVDEGVLRSIVHKTMPLSEARRAHEILQAGGIPGKLVLKVV